ncbi:MAG: class I SAM-dependent methyltransferase [Bacteroidales bacterium]
MSNEKLYDTWAEQYDININKTRDLDRIATMETLSKFKFENVIELGCGTGKNTEWLLARAKRIIGLDFSGEMLEKAKKKIKDPKVEFSKTDLRKNWEINDDFADLITSSLTLEHIENLEHIFEQVQRKLKKGGFFFISELHPFKQYLGSKARFETGSGVKELEVYRHDVSEYINSASQNHLTLIEIKEWFDNHNKKDIPRLITFVFKKM